jgi:small conductance mechanosensitive channel
VQDQSPTQATPGATLPPADPKHLAGTAARLIEVHGPAIVGVILLMTVAWIVSSWLRGATRRALLRTKFDPTLGKFLSNLIRWAILVLALVTSLNVFGIAATSFAAVLGAVTLAIGLGFQNSLSNMAAGVMLLIFRPFKVGDVVTVAGQLGKVNEIDLLITELDTPDGRRVIVPNGSIIGGVIENITHHPRRRVDVPVGVHYEADIDATRAALERALNMVQPRLDDPPPEVVLLELGSSSVNWQLRVWTPRDQFFATRQSALRAAKIALDQAGITIPFPQLDVHLKGLAEGGAIRVLPREQVPAS